MSATCHYSRVTDIISTVISVIIFIITWPKLAFPHGHCSRCLCFCQKSPDRAPLFCGPIL